MTIDFVNLLPDDAKEKLGLLSASPTLYCAEVIRSHLSEYEVSQCIHCDGSFLTGGYVGARRRADAKFCSDKCRVAAMRDRRNKENAA